MVPPFPICRALEPLLLWVLYFHTNNTKLSCKGTRLSAIMLS